MTETLKKPHHHGDLKTALIDAGLTLLSEGGISALTLRGCAARAGVSHAAPAHHFQGLKGLKTAIVTQGFVNFSLAMISEQEAAPDTPLGKLEGVCKGYLTFAENNEAIMTLMFMKNSAYLKSDALLTASQAAKQVLIDACAPFTSSPQTESNTLEVLIWSLVQGYADLVRKGEVNPQDAPITSILALLNLQPRQ